MAEPVRVPDRTIRASLKAKGTVPHGWLRCWLARRQMSQNDLAYAIGREPSLVSRVLRGKVQSAPVWSEIREYVEAPADYRPPKLRDRKRAAALRRAEQILRVTRRPA